jgi:hypothetical protein
MATPARTSIQAIRGYKDHAARNSSIRFNVSSAAATAWATDVTAAGEVLDAFNALDALTVDTASLGRVARYFDDPGITVVVPTSELAVNSAKLLALLQDTVTGKKFSMQIPARDATAYVSTRGLVDINAATRTTQIDHFFTDVVANMLSEDGNSVSCYEIRVIGKGTAA